MVDVGGSLSGITKRFSRRGPWVLKGVDLELHPGSRTVIVGGNGSGKSTLLRIGAGVSWPNGGMVKLPARIGYVPERLAARIRFTGAEYLAHMGRIKGLDPAIMSARSRELLERLDLQPGPKAPIEYLSKGNRQKLVIAQAFLGRVGLLVLDEPFGGLDPTAHATLGELTEEALSGGTAVLMSTHHTGPEQAGVRQLRINGGQLIEEGLGEVSRSRSTREMEVELLPTESAQDREKVVSMPGVVSARLQQPQGVLVLLTDHLHIDRVLTTAVALGWSVQSVHARLHDGRS
jgi:ABC-type multidrug transport system ATPase subunit